MNREFYWHIRAKNYDKLFWVKSKSYIDAIINAGDFKKSDVVLDIGTGTGVIAKAVKSKVKHVVGLDVSDSMLEEGKWDGFSVIKWNIADLIFVNNLFDKLVARMVFHHILEDFERALLRCYDLLKDKGKLIVAEGVPPTDDPDVVKWYTEMFKHKEKRRTFVPRELVYYLEKSGFVNMKLFIHVMKKFSIKDWLVNSGLNEVKQKKLMRMHINASQKVKDAYNMTIRDSDCFVDTKNVIVVATKRQK